MKSSSYSQWGKLSVEDKDGNIIITAFDKDGESCEVCMPLDHAMTIKNDIQEVIENAIEKKKRDTTEQ